MPVPKRPDNQKWRYLRTVAGVAAVVEKLKGHPLFAHITLLRSERSPIAALVTEMLEEISGAPL